MKLVRGFFALFFFLLLPACVSPFLLPSAYLAICGVETQGQLTGKREEINLSDGDRHVHAFDVQYRYRAAGSNVWENGSHAVNATLYDRLRVGAAVPVVYAPWQFLRTVPIVGMGSKLADSTWASRLQGEAGGTRSALEVAGILVAIGLAVLAFAKGFHTLALPAAFAATLVSVAIVPFGWLAFPILFGVARKMPGKGYGWALVLAMVASVYVVYWRIPKTPELPPGPTRQAIATVRQTSLVDHVWGGYRTSGQEIPKPFQVVDLEFTPEGSREPIHVLDRFDPESVPDARKGGSVRVVYPAGEPRSARAIGGTHTYADRLLVYYMEWTYGGSLIMILIVWPLLRLLDRGAHRFTEMAQRGPAMLAQLPADDPRRRKFEEAMAAKVAALPPDSPQRKAFEEFFRKGR